jgi:dienelactone hydrolase
MTVKRLAAAVTRRVRLARRYGRLARRLSRAWLRIDDLTCAGPRPVDPYSSPRGLVAVEREDLDLVDPARGLALSCAVHRPVAAAGPLPVVLYSVPMDWSPGTPSPLNLPLARHVAAGGYVTLHVRHRDSDRFMFPVAVDDVGDRRDYIRERFGDPANDRHRCADLTFLLDSLERWNRDGPCAGLFDLSRVGVCGHSFGAETALTLAGLRRPSGFEPSADPRVRAAIAYSNRVQAGEVPLGLADGLDRPVLYLTGTEDHSYIDALPSEARLWVFHAAPPGCQYAVMLRGADHHTFGGGRAESGRTGNRERLNHQWIHAVSLAFWDAWLRDDAGARRWLDEDLPRLLGGDGRAWRK